MMHCKYECLVAISLIIIVKIVAISIATIAIAKATEPIAAVAEAAIIIVERFSVSTPLAVAMSSSLRFSRGLGRGCNQDDDNESDGNDDLHGAVLLMFCGRCREY